MSERIRLLGRLNILAEIRAKSGLAIGGSEIAPGLGADQAVARDPLTGEPYVPGSSIKGKLRVLTERALGAALAPPASGRREARLHRCTTEKDYRLGGGIEGYAGCPICHLFGLLPTDFPVFPTRLVTRDAPLTAASREALSKKRTELPFTEVKTESTVDRLTAAATPRYRERVPAGAAFEAGWGLSLYEVDGSDLGDAKLIGLLFGALSLLEQDYLGGQGSRGYGRVEIAELHVEIAHDGGLPEAAREIAGLLAKPGGLAPALEAAGNPLSRGTA